MQFSIHAATDVGSKRENNEDSHLVMREKGLIAVCDGMGGHQAGEVASQLAVDTIQSYFNKSSLGDVDYGDIPLHLPFLAKDLIMSIRLANRRIFKASVTTPSQGGMGTTIAAVMMGGNIACVAHVGDSRVYRVRNSQIERLTTDHSPLNELGEADIQSEATAQLSQSHIITRALGIKSTTKIDLRLEIIEQGDIYLICSDGLSDMLPDQDILDIVLSSDAVDIAVAQLIEGANMAGGKDNITVVLAQTRILDEDSITLANPGRVYTIKEEDERYLDKEDEVLKNLFLSGRPEPGSPMKWAIAAIAVFIIFVSIMGYLLLNQNSKEVTDTKSDKEISTVQDRLPQTEVPSVPQPIQTDETLASEEITGHVPIEVYPYSDSVADAYDIFVDEKIISSFADLRQSGLILKGGTHSIKVALNGEIIYNQQVEIKFDGEKLQSLNLDSVVQKSQNFQR